MTDTRWCPWMDCEHEACREWDLMAAVVDAARAWVARDMLDVWGCVAAADALTDAVRALDGP